MTEVADWFAQQDKIGAARTATVLGNDPRSPDALADQAKIAGQLGIPPIVVGSDPAAYKARAEQKSLIDALADAPKTAAWLSNRDNGGLAKDDVENLSWFEKGLKDFGELGNNAVSRGVARGLKSSYGNLKGMGAIQGAIRASDIGLTKEQLIAKEVAALGPLPEDQYPDEMVFAAQMAGAAKFDAIEGMTEGDKVAMLEASAAQLQAARKTLASAAKIGRSEAGQAFLDGPWAKADTSFMGAIAAIADDPVGALAFLGDTAAESLPAMIPAAIATAATRSPAIGAAIMGVSSFAATSSSEAMGFLEQRGLKLDTPEDAMAVLSDQDLMREAQQYGVDKGIIVGALDAISGGVAGKTLVKSRIGDWTLQSLAQAGLGAGGEALSQAAVDGQMDWKQVIVEGLAEFVTAPVEVASMGRDWLKTTSARKEAGRATNALAAIDEKAAASKVKARSPEAFNAAMAQILDGKSVYVPAEEMETYFQAKDMSFDPADWGIDQTAYDAARLSGGKVAVPAASYAAKISGTDDAAWFHEHASATIDDDMSVAEARAFDETKAELLAEADVEQEKILAEERELMPVETEIYDTMVSRNLAAGMSSDVAQTNALLFPKLFSTLAARAGVNIAELARRYALPLVEGAIPNGARPRTVDGLSRALVELRGRKSAGGAKTPLLDFIRDRGGVDDVGGELASRNADAGRKPFQKPLLRKKSDEGKPLALTQAEMASGKRFGLDDTAQAAIEAGFMADNPAVIEWKNAQENGDRVAPDLIPVLLAEIDRELSGGVTDQSAADLDAMEEYLTSLGVTLDMADADIRAAVEAAQAGDGKMYAQSGEIRTDSPAFKEWFGDSKVVDADGKPLVVYHGTASNFEAFSKSADPKHIDLPGFFFTPEAGIADSFAESASRKPFRDEAGYIAGFENANVMQVYLSIQNPAEINLSDRETGKMTLAADVRAMLEKAQTDGHDGAVIRGWSDGSGDVQWVAFAPTQIKSVFNRGTFDANDPRILYQSSNASPLDGLLASVRENMARKDRLTADLADAGKPVMFAAADGSRAMAGPDMSKPGGFRLTYLGQDGKPSGHSEFASLGAAVRRALDERFDPVGATYQQAQEQDQPLYVVHNLSAEKLRHAAALGGLAAPSLAVARGDIGFDSFGEISLIGAPSLANPKTKGVRLFNADVYSPRQPRARFKVDAKVARAINAAIEPVAEKLGLDFRVGPSEIERDGLSALTEQMAVKAAWLNEIGKDVPIKRLTEKEPDPVAGFGSFSGTDAAALAADPAFVQRVNRKYELLLKKNEDSPDLIARLNGAWLDEAGNVSAEMIGKWAVRVALANQEIEAFRAKPVDPSAGRIDRWATGKAIDEAIGERIYDFNAWVREKFGGATTAMFFESEAGRKKDYTLSNLVREMTRTIRNGENWNYGAGNVRAAVAPEFRSLGEVKDARGQITSEKAMEAMKDEVNNELFALADKFAPYAGSMGNGFGWGDTFSEFLRDIAKGPRAVAEWDFAATVPSELMDEARGFLERLKGLPTNYFEIKMQRAMNFSEFSAALVPSNLSADARKILTDAGLELVEYQNGDDGSAARNAALQQIGERVFFQRDQGPRGQIQIGADGKSVIGLSQGGGAINGQIKFPINGLRNGESIISLFQSANLSTFLHETGHYFLEVFSDLASDASAPDALRADLAAVHEWLGSTPGQPFTVQQHEQFARGIEAYLMEGKAPSTALARAFEKFRAWLESVYKTAVALNVNLTPEIRAVFDRMIATDAEIADAKADIGDHVLTSAADLGMTPAAYSRFVQLTQDANAEAAAKLRAETMAPIRRAREKEYREERAKVIAEVTPEMQARPVYRATQEMRFGKGFDGEPVVAMKLDRAAIERDFGAGHIPFLPGATKDGKGHIAAVFGPNGIHPDQAAAAYGFETGAELLQALEEAPPIKEAISAEADRIMFERHGDVLKDGSVEEKALDALHGDKRAQALDMEAAALERLAGEAGGRKAKLAQIKEVARRALAGSLVKNAIASHHYVAAAKKAGDAAFRAIVKKDFAGAASQKHSQIMNHAFYVESRKVADMVDGIVVKVAKLNKPDARLGKARDIDHVKAARAIAARFGLAKPDTAFDFMAWVEQMKFDDPATADAMMSAIEIYGADAKPFNDLTVDQLGAVSDAIDSLLAAGRHARMLEIEGKQVDRQEAEDALLAVIEERGSRDNVADRGAMSKVQRLMAGMKDLTSSTRASLRVVEIWARTMDGGEQGPFTKYLVRPVMDALGEYFTARKARMDAVLEIVKGADLTGKAIAAPELRADGDQPFTFQNKAALLHALLHTGNESNKAKMLIGWRFSDGFANPQQAVTAKGKPRVKRDGTAIMTKGELDTTRWDAFLARMFSEGVITAKDIALVNAIWAQFEETKRPAQATFKKLNGHYFKEVENAPYDTPAGRLNGGYVPAMIDRAVSLDAGRQADLKTLDQTAASMFPTTGKGFTKSRVENYREPLELNLMLIPSHLDSVLRFTYLEPTIRQTSGLLTRRSLRDKLQAFDPALVGDTLMPWLQRTASRSISSVDGTQGKRKWGRAFDRLRGRVGISIMFLNVVNTLQQATGPIVAMNEVSPKKMGMALVRFASGGAFQMRDTIKEASPYMKERLRLVANDSLIAIEDLVRDKGILTSVDQFTQKHGYIIQSAFQNVLDIVVWHAGYDDAVAKGLPHEAAVFEADSHVRRSMPDSAPENVTAFAQGGATWRAITMFSAFFISQANLIGSSASLIRRQMGWNGAPKAFWAYLTLFAIPALLSQAITDAATGGGPDDEDDDGWADDLAAWFGMTQLKYGLAMAPLAGKAVLAGINSFNDNPMDDRLSVSPVVSAFETAARAASSISGAIMGDKSARRATLDGLQVVAMMTGIPTGQLSKTLGYGIGTAEGRYDPQGPVDVMQGVVSGRDGTE